MTKIDIETRLDYHFSDGITASDKMAIVKKCEKTFFLFDLYRIHVTVIARSLNDFWYEIEYTNWEHDNKFIFKFSWSDNTLFSDNSNHSQLYNFFGDNFYKVGIYYVNSQIGVKEQNGIKTSLASAMMDINLFINVWLCDSKQQ